MEKIAFRRLGVSLVLSYLAGVVGSIFTINAINTWYQTLNKPSFNPPAFVFGPVWTILYTLMGISLYLVWNTKGENGTKNQAYLFFGTQLILNTLWPIIFFALQSPQIALIEILFLWVFILLTLLQFLKINRKAGYLLIPYLLWVTFASLLNLFIVLMN